MIKFVHLDLGTIKLNDVSFVLCNTVTNIVQYCHLRHHADTILAKPPSSQRD